jgi:transposase
MAELPVHDTRIWRVASGYVERAAEAIKKWLSWAVRSRLEPVKHFAKFVKNHYVGIIAPLAAWDLGRIDIEDGW